MRRLPNGYGSVCKLSGNRRRPYIVKKTVGFDARGYPIYNIVGYAATKEEGLEMLSAYNRDPWDVDRVKITLQGVFDLWVEKGGGKLAESSKKSLRSAYRHCKHLADRRYKEIRPYQMQECIDGAGSPSAQNHVKVLWYNLDRFAVSLEIIQHTRTDVLTAQTVQESNRIPFSPDEIHRLWEHSDDLWAATVLIMIYSGWRIGELLGLRKDHIDLGAGTMQGGIKTAAGKDRIVPIRDYIRPLVARWMQQPGEYLISNTAGGKLSQTRFREHWREVMALIGASHVPHETRHTFETLLDGAGANRKCIDLMMGHKSKDVGNRVYNHKTINDLKLNLELITVK